MNQSKNKVREWVLMAVFAVLISLCAWLSIPTAPPITMQTFGVFLAFDYLGGKKGTGAVCVYLLLGLLGVPVFANFTSGIGTLTGISGGYLLGWLLSGLSIWLMEALLGRKLWVRILSALVGLSLCYASGTLWYMTVYAADAGTAGLWSALLSCVLPFILPDLGKITLALWLSRRLEKLRSGK